MSDVAQLSARAAQLSTKPFLKIAKYNGVFINISYPLFEERNIILSFVQTQTLLSVFSFLGVSREADELLEINGIKMEEVN